MKKQWTCEYSMYKCYKPAILLSEISPWNDSFPKSGNVHLPPLALCEEHSTLIKKTKNIKMFEIPDEYIGEQEFKQ